VQRHADAMLLREIATGTTAQDEAITALITSRPVW